MKTLRGEWWIDDIGHVYSADGDVDDMNHSSYVIDLLTRRILEDLGIKFPEEFAGPLTEYRDKLCDVLNVEQADLDDALFQNLEHIWENKEQRRAAIQAAFDEIDPRLYAVQYDGWKRIKGNNIETWDLSSDDLNIIVEGLVEIEEDIDDDALFFIEVVSKRTGYSDVPWAVLKESRLSLLRDYKIEW